MNADNPNFRTAEDWEKRCEMHVERIQELEQLVVEKDIELNAYKQSLSERIEANNSYIDKITEKDAEIERLTTDIESGFMKGAYARLQNLQKKERDLQAAVVQMRYAIKAVEGTNVRLISMEDFLSSLQSKNAYIRSSGVITKVEFLDGGGGTCLI